MKRPNILLITTDQHRGDCLDFAGRRVKTPHIDELARTGTHFSSCITPNLVCQPSRASILTGLLPLTHGVRDNGIDLDERTGAAGFAGSLSAAGYATGFIGKAHFSTHHTFARTGRPECQHTEAGLGPDWSGPYMGFGHVELVVEGHNYWLPTPPPGGLHHSRWHYGDGLGEMRNRLYQTDLGPPSGAPQTFHSALPVAWHNSTWIGDRTIDYLRAHRDGRSACGLRSRTRTIPSTARSRGPGCIIPTTWTCPATAPPTTTAAPGGTAPAWKAGRWAAPRSRRCGRTSRASRPSPMPSCATSSPTITG